MGELEVAAFAHFDLLLPPLEVGLERLVLGELKAGIDFGDYGWDP